MASSSSPSQQQHTVRLSFERKTIKIQGPIRYAQLVQGVDRLLIKEPQRQVHLFALLAAAHHRRYEITKQSDWDDYVQRASAASSPVLRVVVELASHHRHHRGGGGGGGGANNRLVRDEDEDSLTCVVESTASTTSTAASSFAKQPPPPLDSASLVRAVARCLVEDAQLAGQVASAVAHFAEQHPALVQRVLLAAAATHKDKQ